MTASTAVSACWFGLNGGHRPVGFPDRTGRGPRTLTAGPPARPSRAKSKWQPSRSLRCRAEEVEPDDFAGRVAVDHVSAQRVDLEGDRRAGQSGPPPDVARRVHDRQLALERRGDDRPAGEVGNRMRHGAAQVVRTLVAAPQVEPLDAVGEAACQDHRSVAADGQPAHVRHQAVLPGDLRLQPARAAGRQDLDPDQHAERRGPDEERPVGQEAKMGHRLDRLEPPGRPAESIEKVHRSISAARGHVPPVGIDRQERRLGRRGPLDLDVEIGVEQKHPGVIAVAQQGDQRPFVADGTRRDPMGDPRERQRFALGGQQVKLVPLVPGEDPTRLAREREPLQRRIGDHRPARLGLQLGRCFFTHPGHWPVRPASIVLIAPQIAHATDPRLPWRERQDVTCEAVPPKPPPAQAETFKQAFLAARIGPPPTSASLVRAASVCRAKSDKLVKQPSPGELNPRACSATRLPGVSLFVILDLCSISAMSIHP